MPEAKQVLNPSHPWYSYDDSARYGRRARVAPSKGTEQDPTQASAPESTDTEMYQVLEKDLLISSDYQAGLVRTVAQVLEVASSVESTRTHVMFSSGNPTKRRKKYVIPQERGMRGVAEASLRRRRRIRQPAPSRGNPTLSAMFPVALAVLSPNTLVIAYLQETSASSQGSNHKCKCFNRRRRRCMTGTRT